MINPLKLSFDNSELEYLLLLKKHFGILECRDLLKSLIKESQYKPVNGIIRSIELDIMGYNEWYCDISGSETGILVLKAEHEKSGKNKLEETIRNRIDSLLKNEITFSTSIYEVKIIKLKFENKLIDVEEFARKDFDYIVFKSSNKNCDSTFFVDISYGGIATYSKVFKLSITDSQLLLNSSPKDIDEIIDKYRLT